MFTLALSDLTDMGSYGIVLTLVVLLVLLFTLQDRRKLRTPVVFLFLHLVLLALRWALPNHSHFQPWIGPLGLFTVLFATTRSLFLLVFETRLGARVLKPLPKIFRDILQALLYAGVLLATLRDAGVEPSSLLTTSALLTAVIGLALQNTLGNIFSGLALQAQKPFEVGDWVELGDDVKNAGQVVEVGWRATKVHTLDEVEVVMPNGKLADMPIRNFTKPSPVSRRTVVVQAAYAVPPARVEAVVLPAIRELPGILASPPPHVVTSDFADSGVTYLVRYFTDDYRAAIRTDSAVRTRIWYAFARAGIEIPYPRRDLVMLDTSKESVSRTEQARLEKRHQALGYVPFLDVLDDATRRELASRTEAQLYGPGETVIRQGDDGDALFIVERGEVAVILEPPNGEPVEVARLGPGKAFGEMSLMTGEKRAATVRATKECELIVVGHDAFGSILAAHADVATRVSAAIAKRQLELDERTRSAQERSSKHLEERSSELLAKIKSFFSL